MEILNRIKRRLNLHGGILNPRPFASKAHILPVSLLLETEAELSETEIQFFVSTCSGHPVALCGQKAYILWISYLL